MSTADPFFRLPVELCCAILRDWLLLPSVVHLDSSVCNVVKRSLLLNTIFASSQYVLPHRRTCNYGKVMLNWLRIRKVRSSGLDCAWEVDASVHEYFETCGSTIRSLSLSWCSAPDYMNLVSQYCSQMSCLILVNYRSGVMGAFQCSSLKALDLNWNVTSDAFEQILTQCPNITHLNIGKCVRLTDQCGEVIGVNLKHLKYLSINNTDFSDSMLLAIAEHNCHTLQELHMHYCKRMVGTGITAMLQKCSKLRSVHITYADEHFVDFDFSLLGNLTEMSLLTLNASHVHLTLVAKHAKKLQRFFLDLRGSPPYDSSTELFPLEELTGGNLPSLKVFAPFGISKEEVEWFSTVRPEVSIDTGFSIVNRYFEKMNF